MKKTVCDGVGMETEICVYREENNECRKVRSKFPYNICSHWKDIEVQEVTERNELEKDS